MIHLENCRAGSLNRGRHKPFGTPELGVIPLAPVHADVKVLAPGRQGRQLPAALTLAS